MTAPERCPRCKRPAEELTFSQDGTICDDCDEALEEREAEQRADCQRDIEQARMRADCQREDEP
jgi:hypothetical protein